MRKRNTHHCHNHLRHFAHEEEEKDVFQIASATVLIVAACMAEENAEMQMLGFINNSYETKMGFFFLLSNINMKFNIIQTVLMFSFSILNL